MTSTPVRAEPSAETTWRPTHPVDVRRTLGPLRRGAGDPTMRIDRENGAVWRTVCGATYRVTQRGPHEITVQAWGPQAEQVVAGVPDLLGGREPDEGFEPRHPRLIDAHARNPGIRVARTSRVMEALVPSVLEQKVTGKEAFAAFRTLVLRFGEPAPGPAPAGMRQPPTVEAWRRVPSWEWHRAGVDPKRSRTICEATRYAARIEEAATMSPVAAAARLSALPGIGVWTVAEIAQRALGDADALSVGDYHLSAYVGWGLWGRPFDDAEMVDKLEPWRPHRYRVVLLLQASGFVKPRFGPRLTVQDHRRH